MNHTLTVSIPDKTLSPNARSHWGAKATAKKNARGEAYIIGLASDLCNQMWEIASTHVVYYHTMNRRRDADNYLARLKSTFDGLADAGIIRNDSGFVHYPIVFKIDKENPRVEITIKHIQENR